MTKDKEVQLFFANFKDACISNGLIEVNEETPKGNTRKRLEKELNCLFKWYKNGRKIIVDEVYKYKLPKEDKRSSNNTYISLVEAIILYKLNNSKTGRLYCSVGIMAEVLGMLNSKFKNIKYLDDETLKEYKIVRSFKMNARSEAKKIIDRALKSMKNRKVIDFAYGRMIIQKDDVIRMATIEEVELLVQIEERILKSFGCNSYAQIETRRLKTKFVKKVQEELEVTGIKNFRSSFNGYAIARNSELNNKTITQFEKREKSKILNSLFQVKLKSVAKSKHNSAIKKLIESTEFGEAIAEGEASENYIDDFNELIETYIVLN